MQEGWLKERQVRLAKSGCNICGGENPRVCACAREQWLKQQNDRPFEFHPSFSHENDLEREWNKLKQTSGGVCAICPQCGGSSMSFCECAKARWMALKKGKSTIPESMLKQPKYYF
jgi:hypothetical protein